MSDNKKDKGNNQKRHTFMLKGETRDREAIHVEDGGRSVFTLRR